MGILEPQIDENGFRFNICGSCGCDVTTPKDSRFNKAKRIKATDKHVAELIKED